MDIPHLYTETDIIILSCTFHIQTCTVHVQYLLSDFASMIESLQQNDCSTSHGTEQNSETK